jgi:hypothetical protein
MGVAEDFTTFRSNYLIPSSVISDISYRYKRITSQLNKDFRNLDSDTAHSMYSGSYGRDTAVKGISDLDVVYSLPVALYEQYRKHTVNGPSALLQAVKKSISKTYPTSDTFGDGQVVVCNFSDGIRFEVLPAFAKQGGGFIFPNANSGGSWPTCEPRAEIDAIQKRHDACNGNLKELCKIGRVWRDYVSAPISGMLIDTLAYQFIETWPHRDKSFLYYDFMARDFFEFLAKQNQTQAHWRAPGSGSHVVRTGVFEHKARSAELRCKEAIDYANTNNQWSSRQKWREVFGPQFPA